MAVVLPGNNLVSFKFGAAYRLKRSYVVTAA